MVAIGLHYLWLTVISWSLVSSLHLYRMLTEMRDVNHGQMGFYHSVGYGLPGIIVGLSVGVRADQYGNYFLYDFFIHKYCRASFSFIDENLKMLLLFLAAGYHCMSPLFGVLWAPYVF